MDTYEKKYNEALERARELIAKWTGKNKDFYVEDYAYIFPELRESEDERALRIIRKRMCYDPVPISDEDRRIVENWLEKKKEQKPASTEEMPYITDEHFYEREPADSFKYKLAEYMTKCCTKKEGPYGYEYGISAESILKMAKEELLKRGVVQKPAEWNANDKAFIKDCARILDENGYAASAERLLSMFPVKSAEWSEEDEKIMQTMIKEGDLKPSEIAWLKSLRPQPQREWSEEDETMINHIIEALPKWANGLITILPSQAEEYVKRLKSLRLQYHGDVTMTEAYKMGLEAGRASSWRPSEVQMKALINCTIGDEYDVHALVRLWAELKKL